MFEIHKCGDENCKVPGCGKLQMDPDEYKLLVQKCPLLTQKANPNPNSNPNPNPSPDPNPNCQKVNALTGTKLDEWETFEDTYDKITTEEDRPSWDLKASDPDSAGSH